MGGGCEMALACDIIIAADHARFGLPEPRVGLFAGAGGVHRLPRRIPLSIAMGMILTGKAIDAAEAARWGLANEVVPLAQLMPTAERWANEILQCAPLSVRGSKEAALTGLDLPLETAMRRSYDNLQAHMASADRIEGPKAFAEKRPPAWTAHNRAPAIAAARGMGNGEWAGRGGPHPPAPSPAGREREDADGDSARRAQISLKLTPLSHEVREGPGEGAAS
jgi:1,4-dihydroxy-2-naphthoyl-CoA synthase